MAPRRRSFSTGQRSAWEKLGERTRLMLQRLNDCILLDEDDRCALAAALGSGGGTIEV